MVELPLDPATDSSRENFKYWAFISYSSQDKRVSRWLRDALAGESIPAAFRKWTTGGKKTVEDVFLDETSLSASPRVDMGLQQSLRASRNLIVICSPFAVASAYVDEEISYFTQLGRADNVICLIASGIPNATDDGKPEFECFPKALRFEINPDGTISDRKKPVEKRPLAAALGMDTPADRRQAMQKIMAGLFGISVDDLRGLRQRRFLKGLIAAAACLLALGVTAELVWSRYFRPTLTYYQNYERRWGEWEGYDQVSAETARQLDEVYEFTTRGNSGKVDRVRLINGSGFCPISGIRSILGNSLLAECTNSRACEARLTYSSDGRIDSETMIDSFGVPLETLTYNAPNVATFVEAGFGCQRTQSGIQYVRLKRYEGGSSRGLTEKIEFLGPDKKPRINHSGAYGLRYDYDGIRIRSVTYLDQAGQAKIGSEGYSGLRSSYDANNRLAVEEYLLPNGAPALTKAGYSRINYTSDALGRFMEYAYQNASGQPTLTRDGITGHAYKYDARGNIVEDLLFGVRHERVLNKEGISGRRFSRNEKGNATEIVFLGVDDKPTTGKDGFAVSRTKYDQQSNAIEVSTYGIDDSLALQRNGYAIAQSKYDDKGHKLEETYLDIQRKPAPDKDGIAKRQNIFDDKSGRRIGEKYFGREGELTTGRRCSAEVRLTLDDRGNQVESVYFGLDGNPVAKEGVATTRYTVDESGNQTEVTYFGADGHQTVDNEGNAGWRAKYDERGNKIETVFLGIDGKPSAAGGFSGLRSRFDDRGNKTETAYIDAEGKPAASKDGYAGWRSTFDALGNVVEIAYFGIDGRAAVSVDGYATQRSKLDRLGNTIETAFFGVNGKPTVANNGYAGWRSKFDDYGNLTETAYFGVDGKPALNVGGHAGRRYTFDARGNQVELVYLGPDGKPINLKNGVSIIRSRHDERGNRIEVMYFSADGKPTAGADGNAGSRSRYDDPNNEIETGHFDINGNLTATKNGIVVERAKYDHCGNRIERTFFDANGERATAGLGNHRNLYFYDSWNRQIRAEYYGLDGKRAPLTGMWGDLVSAVSRKYDLFGQLLEEQYFGRDEEPVPGEQGAQRVVNSYDNLGKVIETRYYDVDGKQMTPP